MYNGSTTSRRNFLKQGSLITSLAFLSPNDLLSMNRQQQKTFVRKDVNSLTDDDPIIKTYRKAVKAMKDLPDDHPFSWVSQAQIHLNFCPHGNWFFLPWHRAYLLYFEDICRELTGDEDFALPYWNWTKDPQIPRFFWEDPLLNGSRTVGPTDSISVESTGQTIIDGILKERDFELFASSKPFAQNSLNTRFQRSRGASATLEFTPHNDVHVWIAGDMQTFMSPLDPIFWLHHCNVDRLWAKWNASNNNTSNNLWKDFTFKENFVNRDGKKEDVVISSISRTRDLSYVYDDSALISITPSTSLALSFFQQPRIEKFSLDKELTTNLNRPLDLPVQVKRSLMENVKSAESIVDQPVLRTLAVIKGLKAPKDLNTRVRVFLNCNYLTKDTPYYDPHYVGSISFFGTDHEHEGHHEDASYVVDLSKTISRLNRLNEINVNELNVQLMPISFNGRETEDIEIKVKSTEVIFI